MPVVLAYRFTGLDGPWDSHLPTVLAVFGVATLRSIVLQILSTWFYTFAPDLRSTNSGTYHNIAYDI